MNELEPKLRQCFQAVFPDLEDTEIPRASMASMGAWDSVTTVTLLALVEEQFEVRVAPEEMEDLVSYELILDYLSNLNHGS